MSSTSIDVPPETITINGHQHGLAAISMALFLGYTAEDVPLLSVLVDPNAKAEKGFVTDIYGIRTRVADLWPEMLSLDGALTGIPIPGCFAWETLEWVALVKSVLSAGSLFRMMELGAGWGPAAVGSAVMARMRGILDIHVTAVEADSYHVQFLRRHMEDNNLRSDQYTVIEAAVGTEEAEAEWPDATATATEYGNRPITAEGDYLGRPILATRKVKILAIRDLIRREREWDMLHVDIQGSELEVFQVAMDLCNERVARVCIGTHSRKIDGDLLELFVAHGWILDHEKPTKMVFQKGARTLEAMNIVDGTQVWRNPRLRPEDARA